MPIGLHCIILILQQFQLLLKKQYTCAYLHIRRSDFQCHEARSSCWHTRSQYLKQCLNRDKLHYHVISVRVGSIGSAGRNNKKFTTITTSLLVITIQYLLIRTDKNKNMIFNENCLTFADNRLYLDLGPHMTISW